MAEQINRATAHSHGLQEILRQIGKKAGVKPCGPHRYRHTFAISYLRNGGDLITLRHLLGHKSLDMVRPAELLAGQKRRVICLSLDEWYDAPPDAGVCVPQPIHTQVKNVEASDTP